MSQLAIIAAQLNAVRASLVAGLEQCDAMLAVMKTMATPTPPLAAKPELEEGEFLLHTFGGAKAPPPPSSDGAP